MGVWPLLLASIDGEPLCEHTYDARLAKRALDIDWALSNPGPSAQHLLAELDAAIRTALPDFSQRLELRAQRLLDRCLEHSAPAWYRNAPSHQREALARHLAEYDEARQTLLNLFGHAASPQTLARYQLLEQLATDLEINDLDPDRLHVRTRRSVARVGTYEQKHSLTELALRGLHSGDELAGSTFLLNTSFTYADAPLPEAYQDLTADYLVGLLDTLKPRVAFETVRREYYAKPEIHAAIEQLLDRRLNALAYTAKLQRHITAADYQRFTRLRRGTDAQLRASSVALNGYVLKDLWLLRESDEQGGLTRLLLCTPEAPQAQQFHGFDSEVLCQAHLLAWCADDAMRAYLLEQVPPQVPCGPEHLHDRPGLYPGTPGIPSRHLQRGEQPRRLPQDLARPAAGGADRRLPLGHPNMVPRGQRGPAPTIDAVGRAGRRRRQHLRAAPVVRRQLHHLRAVPACPGQGTAQYSAWPPAAKRCRPRYGVDALPQKLPGVNAPRVRDLYPAVSRWL
ncbi:DUF6543 domain-containing protein [Pseudomonas simiae]